MNQELFAQLRAFAEGYLACNDELDLTGCGEWDSESAYLNHRIRFTHDADTGTFAQVMWNGEWVSLVTRTVEPPIIERNEP